MYIIVKVNGWYEVEQRDVEIGGYATYQDAEAAILKLDWLKLITTKDYGAEMFGFNYKVKDQIEANRQKKNDKIKKGLLW